MSLNALMRWLKPREMVFFDLLESAAANAYQASQLFDLEFYLPNDMLVKIPSASRSCGAR